MKASRWLVTGLCVWAVPLAAFPRAAKVPEFSQAGYFPLAGSGREVFNFNSGWVFYKGDVKGAESESFDDALWEPVSLPHGLELLPSEASGCSNYQGPAWYRKHFRVPAFQGDRQTSLYFEGIMGKCGIWLNGRFLAEHFGGYLPVVLNVTEFLRTNGDNVISVRADNSDDISYPPGKTQKELDFCYFGGIYRDAWMVQTARTYITDPNAREVVAGGGVFIHVNELSSTQAVVSVQTELANKGPVRAVRLEANLKGATGETVAAESTGLLSLSSNVTKTVTMTLRVATPHAWDPDDPYLYALELRVLEENNRVVDGVRLRAGLRTFAFKPGAGLILNGRPYSKKLIGGNRHQDYAYVGNALPNSGQWRDAFLLRSAGMRIIRSAHYPQDPAFMDACDELGLFVIVSTPGWQFWNSNPSFAEKVMQDIRNMVRRDRNHASVLWWEPVLNETSFPGDFGRRIHEVVRGEYPFPECATASDHLSPGAEFATILYSHPIGDQEAPDRSRLANLARTHVFFTREWGDNVDDWSSHNSPSRVARGWGEAAQLRQLEHYGCPDYPYICLNQLYAAAPNHMGGCLWHPFDHQRGYHPDPFYGGILDAFRQKKYSWFIFASQRDPGLILPRAESGPMVFIAHEGSPISPRDIRVLTNCEEVRLTALGCPPVTLPATHPTPGAGWSKPWVVFTNAFDFQRVKALHRKEKIKTAEILAEGLIDGKVVAQHRLVPATRPAKLSLELADCGVPLTADGADVVPIIASVTDADGHVKRLNEYSVRFEASGEGSLLGDATIFANPRKVDWGTAPALIRSTQTPGKITVRAFCVPEGVHMPASAALTFESVAAVSPMVGSSPPPRGKAPTISRQNIKSPPAENSKAKDAAAAGLRKVEQDQTRFETEPLRN